MPCDRGRCIHVARLNCPARVCTLAATSGVCHQLRLQAALPANCRAAAAAARDGLRSAAAAASAAGRMAAAATAAAIALCRAAGREGAARGEGPRKPWAVGPDAWGRRCSSRWHLCNEMGNGTRCDAAFGLPEQCPPPCPSHGRGWAKSKHRLPGRQIAAPGSADHSSLVHKGATEATGGSYVERLQGQAG